jgi:PEP-CTERM motif
MKGKMTNMKISFLLIVAVAALLFTFGAPTSFATGISLNVSINTSGLPTTPGSEIFFIFTDGSGTGDANNTATLSAFALGGGTVGTVDLANTFGGTSGDMASTVSLTDSSFTNVFAETFSAGSSLSFLLNLTTNLDAGGTPDQFSVAIADPSGAFISTLDPTGFNNLLLINLDSVTPSATTYSNLVTASLPAPVPEPGTVLLLGSGLLALVGAGRRRIFH